MPAARRERASAVKSSPAALRTNSGCFVQWQLRVRTTEGEGTSRRSTTSIAEMRAHPASATQPWPSPSTQQRDQSIERLQRQSKSSIFAIVNSPGGIRRCICSANFHPKCWSAIGCVRFSSAPCFHKRCCSQIVDTTRTGSGSFPASQKHGRTFRRSEIAKT